MYCIYEKDFYIIIEAKRGWILSGKEQFTVYSEREGFQRSRVKKKAIVSEQTVKAGNIYPSGRVWAMLDTLLTADTILDARDISKER